MLEMDNQDTSPPERLNIDPSPERVFARRMKRERLRRNWRQEDLAEKLSKFGIDLHPSAIAKMEREPDPEKKIEPRMIRLNEAKVIAFVFQLSLDAMLKDEDLHSDLANLQEQALKYQQRRMELEAELRMVEQFRDGLQVMLEDARTKNEEAHRLWERGWEKYSDKYNAELRKHNIGLLFDKRTLAED